MKNTVQRNCASQECTRGVKCQDCIHICICQRQIQIQKCQKSKVRKWKKHRRKFCEHKTGMHKRVRWQIASQTGVRYQIYQISRQIYLINFIIPGWGRWKIEKMEILCPWNSVSCGRYLRCIFLELMKNLSCGYFQFVNNLSPFWPQSGLHDTKNRLYQAHTFKHNDIPKHNDRIVPENSFVNHSNTIKVKELFVIKRENYSLGFCLEWTQW